MNLEEMEALEKLVTPGPWYHNPHGDLEGEIGDVEFENEGRTAICFTYWDKEDAKFIAASRNFVPWACKRIRELEKDREVLENKIQSLLEKS